MSEKSDVAVWGSSARSAATRTRVFRSCVVRAHQNAAGAADRLDIIRARWSPAGAEAVIKLRALISNGDLDAYWRYHLEQEHKRSRTARYQP